ncbi:hypothetical protein [Microcoleus sp. PH2017_30_WIL_O_A]|uniref:hypothetical protein n=1 Tax=Microcoleus sp. PH2017_30_WIL_O_A TaxID=2798840 RepID=UPI001D1A7BB0|nr:hypothetical protein [Microcoleus sp. PH2017_30_WIL_O_A]MCC3587763.1 hypothetical protein [Microcoleus sp. PH2017_30_WIL_O_A]
MDVWGGQDASPTGVSGIFAVCDRVYGAIAHSAFPDNARIVEQVSAIGFGKFMCLCANVSVMILCF